MPRLLKVVESRPAMLVTRQVLDDVALDEGRHDERVDWDRCDFRCHDSSLLRQPALFSDLDRRLQWFDSHGFWFLSSAH